MTISLRAPRPLDHLVLPVEDIAIARARLGALGFTVAPDARHPFGTENACVFLADGTYIEPLGVASREECEENARLGNVFVARDQAFRFRQGQNGFNGLVMGSQDAGADHQRFDGLGMSAGPLLEFSRPMVMPDGSQSMASFRLAFAADLRSPDFYGFTVERINVPVVDRSALITHANGVSGIAQIVLSEANPTDFQYFLEELVNQREINAHSFGMSLEAANATITVLNGDGMAGFLGCAPTVRERGLRGEAIVFQVADLDRTRHVLNASQVNMREVGARIVVDPQPGQGAMFVFEERP